MNMRSVGAHALLIEVDDPLAWHAELVRRRNRGELTARDIVPGARTVLVDGVPDPAALMPSLRGWLPTAGTYRRSDRLIEIPVTFDGPDLATVAGHWGCDGDDVVGRLCATEFRVAFSGFAPGFAYLTGLPPELAVPRLDTPRTRVPAGSVGLAGPYAGIYPTASPGGWLLVGRTGARLFDVDARPPALLVPGARVRFTA
ncbi:5-oxoprolinase subunit B family protein [Planosporangium sp. 12N6]|uniref:5-oxoprolinase subunit B family protein n=1 Tax=Planosporangium spinosum TaxID=3402278 RepID=UPI003CE77789